MLAGSTSTFGPGQDYAVIHLTTIILVFIGKCSTLEKTSVVTRLMIMLEC